MPSIAPTVFLFDAVYILKRICNNWLNLKSLNKSFVLPHFDFGNIPTKHFSQCPGYALASFNALKQLNSAECDSLIKFVYKLRYKALNSAVFERQIVKLAFQVCNKFTAEALTIIGEKLEIPHYATTIAFIKIIVTEWWIANAKTPWKGKRLKNCLKSLLQPRNILRLDSFWNILLSEWKIGEPAPVSKNLLRKLFQLCAIQQTNASLETADYCMPELYVKNVPLGKFQTDCLDARFELYRQLALGNHDAFLCQIYECEKKICLFS